MHAPAAASRLMNCFAIPRELVRFCLCYIRHARGLKPALAVRLRWPQARIMIHWIIRCEPRALRSEVTKTIQLGYANQTSRTQPFLKWRWLAAVNAAPAA